MGRQYAVAAVLFVLLVGGYPLSTPHSPDTTPQSGNVPAVPTVDNAKLDELIMENITVDTVRLQNVTITNVTFSSVNLSDTAFGDENGEVRSLTADRVAVENATLHGVTMRHLTVRNDRIQGALINQSMIESGEVVIKDTTVSGLHVDGIVVNNGTAKNVTWVESDSNPDGTVREPAAIASEGVIVANASFDGVNVENSLIDIVIED